MRFSGSSTMMTNLRLLVILLCLIWQTNQVPLLSQSIDYIDGKVINSTTFEPVPESGINLIDI
jgi:hypothetical protein